MKTKVLFIDRDGTIIKETAADCQIDSYDKFEFLPYSITYLQKIAKEFDYQFVMVTNQDGLGTDNFPESTFWPVHNTMLNILENEGVKFEDIFIDKTYPHENAPTRKPGVAMLTKYLEGDYDLENSYVIGDRETDVLLAKNLGSKAIVINNPIHEINTHEYPNILKCHAYSWEEIYNYLKLQQQRTGFVKRTTTETDINIALNLDGSGKANIQTGLHFFDHMLEQIARHSGCDLTIHAKGDLQVDEHHTIEDTAIALGEAFLQALGNKKGIERYGFCLPMDDCLAQVAIDFGGRSWIVWEADFKREKVGDMPTEMFFHFFKSFTDSAKCNLNIKAEGTNEHHKIEAIFKAFAKAIKMAIQQDERMILPSTKGSL